MDLAFVDWITKKHDNLSPELKQRFLLALKNDPDQVVAMIANSLEDWAKQSVLETGANLRLFDLSDVEYSARLTKHLERHFARELETIQ